MGLHCMMSGNLARYIYFLVNAKTKQTFDEPTGKCKRSKRRFYIIYADVICSREVSLYFEFYHAKKPFLSK